MSPVTDHESPLADAMRAGRAGDSAAYARALGEIARLVRPRIGRWLGASGGEVEDVVQNVLLAVHLKQASWDDRLPILPWVRAIADHKMRDAARARRRRDRIIAVELSADDVADTVAAPDPASSILGLDIGRLVDALPGRERQVVTALALEGGTIAVAAAALGLREGAVRVAFHRALKRLAGMAATGQPPARRPRDVPQ